MDTISHGQWSLYMQTIFKKCPFKENGKLLKLFCLILRGIICQQGLIPHRAKPSRYQTPQNKILRGIRPCGTKSCGVSPAEQPSAIKYTHHCHCSARSDTLKNNILRGQKLRLTKSCGVSDPAEQSYAGYHTQGNNFKYKYFREFKKEFKNILGCEFWDYMGSIHGKNQRSKISCYCPFNTCQFTL